LGDTGLSSTIIFAHDCPPIHSEPGGHRFDKSNILLLGPTGCGKTLLASTVAKLLQVMVVGMPGRWSMAAEEAGRLLARSQTVCY